MIFLRWIILLCLFASSMVQAEVAVPEFQAYVTDLTNTLTTEQIASLENKLVQLEQAKGSQVAVLIVPTTDPETIEQFSLRVVEKWKLGRKKVDDGVLLLVAKEGENRAVRIEVSYGLEGVIPDAIANRITDEYIVPAFKQDDYYGGIDQAVEKLTGLIQGEALPEPEQTADEEGWLSMVIVGVVVIGSVLRMIFGRIVGASVAAGLAGAAGMLLGGVLAGLTVGIIAFVFVLSNSRGIGGFGGGRGGSGGVFKGGGGGRFGGGGATGRW